MVRLQEEVHRTERYAKTLSVVMADLAYAVLEEFASDMGIKRCDELLAGVDSWATETGRPPPGSDDHLHPLLLHA